jgi:TPR repeat protein
MLVVVALFVENFTEHCYAAESCKNVNDSSQPYESSQKTSVDHGFEKLFERFSKAAEQGYVSAQFNLGAMYYNGNFVDQNFEKAFEWFSKAAEQGNAPAQYNLGLMYYDGDFVDENFEKAFEWFSKAAEQGDALGRVNAIAK